jgi:hypothetical protein
MCITAEIQKHIRDNVNIKGERLSILIFAVLDTTILIVSADQGEEPKIESQALVVAKIRGKSGGVVFSVL